MECEASIKVRFTSDVTKELAKYGRYLMAVQKVTLDNGCLEPAEDFSVFYGEKYKNY